MSDRNEREDRAFEALIVSHLLRERDITDLNDLPELTDSQRAAMNAAPPDLVAKLWDAVDEQDTDSTLENYPFETAVENAEEYAGMNRAEHMEDETKRKLDDARREVLEAMRVQMKGRQNAKSQR